MDIFTRVNCAHIAHPQTKRTAASTRPPYTFVMPQQAKGASDKSTEGSFTCKSGSPPMSSLYTTEGNRTSRMILPSPRKGHAERVGGHQAQTKRPRHHNARVSTLLGANQSTGGHPRRVMHEGQRRDARLLECTYTKPSPRTPYHQECSTCPRLNVVSSMKEVTFSRAA